MSEREGTTYEPGTPCWVDLGTPDQDAAGEFYRALFGWEIEADENAEATGGYRVARKGGRAVGGVMRLVEEGQPPAWLAYFATDDADGSAARAREAGGTVLVEPMSVLDYGRMAVVADPTGAAFGLWQAGRNPGFGVMREPGAVNWCELNTRDPGAAKAFYGSVFDWEFSDQEFEGAGTYTTIGRSGRSFGGMIDITDRVPAEVPAHWLVYFTVEDARAIVDLATDRGGQVPFGPVDMAGVGTFAVLLDPFGAAFAVLEPDPSLTPGS